MLCVIVCCNDSCLFQLHGHVAIQVALCCGARVFTTTSDSGGVSFLRESNANAGTLRSYIPYPINNCAARIIDTSIEDVAETILRETQGLGVTHVWQLTRASPHGTPPPCVYDEYSICGRYW